MVFFLVEDVVKEIHKLQIYGICILMEVIEVRISKKGNWWNREREIVEREREWEIVESEKWNEKEMGLLQVKV